MMKRKSNIRTMILISLFSTFMCLGAWIHFPSPVPTTMQTFVIMCSLGILRSKKTFAVLSVYIMLGALGLPVFSGFTGGVGALMGPTAGFIWGFLLGVPLFYMFERKAEDKRYIVIIGYILYILLHYITGALWYCYFSLGKISLEGLISTSLVTVVPFIIPDGIKLVLSLIVTDRIKKIIKTKLK